MQGKQANKVSALVISPTRELAQQIAVEAEALGTFHDITVQVGPQCSCCFHLSAVPTASLVKALHADITSIIHILHTVLDKL